MSSAQRIKIAATFALLLLANLSGRAAELRLRPEFVCRRPVVTVGDIADLRNLRHDEAEEIAAIELFTAPPSREPRFVKLSELRELLSLHGVDLAAIQFRGAEQVQIRSAAASSAPVDGEVVRRDPTRLAFHTKRTIMRGETIHANDIEAKPLPDRFAKQEYITSIEEIVGHEAMRQLDPGSPVVSSSLRRPLAIARNETISLVARSAGVQVRTSVKAMEEGAIGDLITIETLDKSKHRLSARVTGPKVVEIYAGVPVVSATR